MDADAITLKLIDSRGVLPLLLMVSGYIAMERESDSIEPRDLIKAIYIVDLEHVSMFWSNWEGFERLVTNQTLIAGQSVTYINRILYLVRAEATARESSGSFSGLGIPSPALQEMIAAARKLASERTGSPTTPSSRDLLFCSCCQDLQLSAALRKSGLQFEKLTAAVGK